LTDSISRDASGFALVLGGGGWPAHAYFAGVFDAFAESGVDLAAAASISGTSAGALNGALLASGFSVLEAADVAVGWSMSAESKPFERAWCGRRDLAARLHGNALLMRALTPLGRRRGGWKRLTRQRLGLYRTSDPGRYFGLLPDVWPERPVAFVSFDAVRGRRAVLTRESSLGLSFHQAVEASTAIPALLEPVRTDKHVLVDGGVASATNLDVAANSGALFTICVAPMSYDVSLPPSGMFKLAYRKANRTLAAQARPVRWTGQDVLYIRPGHAVIREIGLNVLAAPDSAKIRQLALVDTRRQLRLPRSRRLFEQVARGDLPEDRSGTK
jgi:NTE family protein